MKDKILIAFFTLLTAIHCGNAGIGQDPGGLDLEGMNATARIDTLLKLTNLHLSSEPALALKYAQLLREVAVETNSDTTLINALNLQGKIYFLLGDLDTAKVLCSESLALSDQLGNVKKMAESTFLQGILVSVSEDPRKGLQLFIASNAHHRILRDSLGMANTHNAIGATYFDVALYDSAVFHLLESIRIAKRKGYDQILAKAYLNLGLVYDELEEFPEAKTCFKRSMDLNRDLNNLVNLGKSYQNLGNILSTESDFDSAWILYSKALEISLSLNNMEGIAHAYIGLGEVADNRGDFKKGYELYAKAKHYYKRCNNRQGELISYKNMGLVMSKTGKYREALAIFDSSLIFARNLGLTKRELEIYDNICHAYVGMEDYRNAYLTYREMNMLDDSIMDVEKRERIAELEILFEKEKDNAHILSLQNENLKLGKRNITYLASGSSALMVLIFLFAYYSQRTRKNRIIAEQRIVQLEKEKKLLAARSIVEGQEEERKRIAKELHDGLGVLLSSAKMHFTSFRDKTPEAMPVLEKAASLLEQASGDVRRISHNMMPGLLTKYGLFEAVEELLEQVDEMEGVHAKVDIRGEQRRLAENTEIMLYRIVQEMVNNTLKHAEAQNLKLKIEILDDRLIVEYSDDGKGFDMEEKLRQKSMGLTGLQSRVKFLGGELQAVTSPGKGVRYDFEVPIDK